MNTVTHLLSRKQIFTIFLLIFAGALFTSCTSIDVFEKNAPLPKNEWRYDHQPTFEFNITDTVSRYNLFIVLRHTDAYRYNNIWLNVGNQAPGDSVHYQRFDLQLGTDASGWEGNGMGDIWELRKSVTNGPFKFNRTGNYKFIIAQVMRENPLTGVMSVGIRVEKVK